MISDIPNIAVSNSEEVIARMEAGDVNLAAGEVLIGIQPLTAIAENNPVDVVADAASAEAAPAMYARELREDYETTGPDTITLGEKTVSRAGARIFSWDQLIYGWDEYVVYASAAAGAAIAAT